LCIWRDHWDHLGDSDHNGVVGLRCHTGVAMQYAHSPSYRTRSGILREAR
jgi:hypothetical protein